MMMMKMNRATIVAGIAVLVMTGCDSTDKELAKDSDIELTSGKVQEQPGQYRTGTMFVMGGTITNTGKHAAPLVTVEVVYDEFGYGYETLPTITIREVVFKVGEYKNLEPGQTRPYSYVSRAYLEYSKVKDCFIPDLVKKLKSEYGG